MTIRTRTELEAIFATLGVSHITPADMRDFLESLELYDERQIDYRATDLEVTNTTFVDSGLQFVLRKRGGVSQVHRFRFELRILLDSSTVGCKLQWANPNGATFNLFYTPWRFMRDDFVPIDTLLSTSATQVFHAPAGTSAAEFILYITGIVAPNVYNDGDVISLQFAQDATGGSEGAHILPGSVMFVTSFTAP